MELLDLPDRYDALLFLAGKEPVFKGDQTAVTREAADQVTTLYRQLKERRAAGSDVLRDFLLQTVWCMFAEDMSQLPTHRLTNILDQLIKQPRRSSADDLGGLFEVLNTKGDRPEHGLYAEVPYADGGLFQKPAHVHLEKEELELLRAACEFDWKDVQPQIFGSLLEGGLGEDKQWELSAHYTHEADIRKVVQPTIVEPWRERIENISTHKEARKAQSDLINFVVLDPACGSGNFLYIAYRELRRLEKRLREREVELRRKSGLRDQESMSLFFPLQNIRGIEIDPFAVSLARVTLWMGHKLAVDELDLSEATLPLGDLSGVQIGDALKIDWPEANAIIGNPPFHGSQNMRKILGDDYVEWLKDTFKVGVKDYCVYWFRKAHDNLPAGGQAGLVGTNSISQNRGRGASLQYIVENGGVITNAVSKQKWPGEAVVNVSIVNWIKQPSQRPNRLVLDGAEVDEISLSLRPCKQGADTAEKLQKNKGRAFQGPIPVGDGFVLTPEEAEGLLDLDDANYEEVVRPYLVGADIARDPAQAPTRYIIDFANRLLEEAMDYPGALEVVRRSVKPVREKNKMKRRREIWWQLGSSASEMRRAVSPLKRFITCNRIGKRILVCWCDSGTCPSDLTIVFAFEDDYAMGMLASAIHTEWARFQSSTLRVDIRYTPTSAFETFPWPQADEKQRKAIGEVTEKLIKRRQEICDERQIGLTDLYNQVDDGAWRDLADLHRELDSAVAQAYGWSSKIAQETDQTNSRLLELNRKIIAGEVEYEPFAYLGQDPKELV